MNTIFAVTFLAIIGVCLGFNCYDCQYKKVGDTVSGQKECKGDLDNARHKTCPNMKFQHCGVFKAKPDNRTEIIMRGCVLEANEGTQECKDNFGSPWPDFHKGAGHFCVCPSENCNTATALSAFTMLTILSALSMIFL